MSALVSASSDSRVTRRARGKAEGGVTIVILQAEDGSQFNLSYVRGPYKTSVALRGLAFWQDKLI